MECGAAGGGGGGGGGGGTVYDARVTAWRGERDVVIHGSNRMGEAGETEGGTHQATRASRSPSSAALNTGGIAGPFFLPPIAHRAFE